MELLYHVSSVCKFSFIAMLRQLGIFLQNSWRDRTGQINCTIIPSAHRDDLETCSRILHMFIIIKCNQKMSEPTVTGATGEAHENQMDRDMRHTRTETQKLTSWPYWWWKRTEREANHRPSSTADVKSVWGFTSTPLVCSMLTQVQLYVFTLLVEPHLWNAL